MSGRYGLSETFGPYGLRAGGEESSDMRAPRHTTLEPNMAANHSIHISVSQRNERQVALERAPRA
jgi:hypothetical protein